MFAYDLQTEKQENMKQKDDGKYYLPIGKYTIEFIRSNGKKVTKSFEISDEKE